MKKVIAGLALVSALLGGGANAQECRVVTPSCVELYTYAETRYANGTLERQVVPALAEIEAVCESAAVSIAECDAKCTAYCDSLADHCAELVAGCQATASASLAACQESLVQCRVAAEGCADEHVLPLVSGPTVGTVLDDLDAVCSKSKVRRHGGTLKVACKVK